MEQNQIRICMGSSCFARGNAENMEFIKKFLQEKKLNEITDFRGHLCTDKCKIGPNLIINNIIHNQVNSNDLENILTNSLK